MPEFVFNVAKGRVAELYKRVDDGDPGTAELVIAILDTATADATLLDLDTLALVIGDAGTAEVTNTNYARKILTGADIVAFAPDDVNDRVDLDVPDQTWTAVAAGDGWTDALFGYDGPGTGVDANIVPLTWHDFVATPNGGDITMQLPNGFFRAS